MCVVVDDDLLAIGVWNGYVDSYSLPLLVVKLNCTWLDVRVV